MITQGLANSYKAEILNGLHRSDHEYRMALFTSKAALSEDTTIYEPTGEVSAPGYEPGGIVLTGRRSRLDGRVAILDWHDPQWSADITARGALIYNVSIGHRAVLALDFGKDLRSVNGWFRVTLPPPTASTAVIRID